MADERTKSRRGTARMPHRGGLSFGAVVAAAVLGVSATGVAAVNAQELPLLVSVDRVAEIVEQSSENVRIVDYGRSLPGYLVGHIPGAVRIAKSLVYDRVDGVDGRLPDPQTVADGMGKAGIDNETQVIIYDASDGLWAARLFWALEYLGHTKVSIMDGGFRAWRNADHPVSRGRTRVETTVFSAVPKESRHASTDWVLSNVDNEAVLVVDARSPSEYSGNSSGSRRKGHVPGAVNVEWVENLRDGENSVFKPQAVLSTVYRRANPSEHGEIVTYCQTGVRASHAYFALRLLGYENVRVYDDSWEVWGNREDTPIDR